MSIVERIRLGETTYVIEVERLKHGAGAPTKATEGSVGHLYQDTTSGLLYQCKGVVSGEYLWDRVTDIKDLETVLETLNELQEHVTESNEFFEGLEEVDVDEEPVADSPNPITSGGVFNVLEEFSAGVRIPKAAEGLALKNYLPSTFVDVAVGNSVTQSTTIPLTGAVVEVEYAFSDAIDSRRIVRARMSEDSDTDAVIAKEIAVLGGALNLFTLKMKWSTAQGPNITLRAESHSGDNGSFRVYAVRKVEEV